MNHFTNTTCCYCGSSIHLRSGSPHCSADNLKATKAIFDSILEMESLDAAEFEHRLVKLQEHEYTFDLFMDYWNRKRKSPKCHIKCIHKDTYFRDTSVGEPQLPMPKAYIPFPDLAEVYIAEIMLGRELTGREKDGSRYIPKINESGGIYFAALTWITWPHSYISLKDMVDKTDYDESPLVPIFNIEDIRGIYSGRDGDEVDD